MADATVPKVLFYFDFISPYAFLAWTQIRAIAARHGRELEPVPILFAALLDAHGTKGPAEIPAKRRYLFKDIARKAHRYGVRDVRPPPAHPFNPLHALRVCSSPSLTRDDRERAIDALFLATWTRHRAIDSLDAVGSILTEAGFDPQVVHSLLAEAQTQAAKDRVRQATEEAIRKNVFGVPTVEVAGEIFWGTDALIDLDAFLGGLLPAFSDAEWASLPAAAQRKFRP